MSRAARQPLPPGLSLLEREVLRLLRARIADAYAGRRWSVLTIELRPPKPGRTSIGSVIGWEDLEPEHYDARREARREGR